jgi:hypothetical protein
VGGNFISFLSCLINTRTVKPVLPYKTISAIFPKGIKSKYHLIKTIQPDFIYLKENTMEILSNIKLLWLSLSNALKLDEHESWVN